MTQNEIDTQIANNVSWAYTRVGLVVGWVAALVFGAILAGMLSGLVVIIWKGVYYIGSCT